MLSLSVDSTSKSGYFLFNEYLGATVRLYDVCETSRHCCVPAINTSTVPTAVAVVLLRVHWFVADQARCVFVGVRLYNVCGVGAAGCGSINLLATETRKQRSSASYASLLGCMRCAPVCEVDCDSSVACSVGVSMRLL